MSDTLQEYVRQVMSHVPHASPHRDRIARDVRAHLEEAVGAGEPLPAILERMGTPEELARGYLERDQPRYASHARRILAFLLDMGVGLGFVLLVFAFAGAEVALLRALGASTSGTWGDPGSAGTAVAAALIFTALTAFVLAVAYFPVLEGRYGQTLGKWLTGLYVARTDGLRAGYKEAIVRRIPFFLEFFWIDAIVALFTQRRQRAFDLVASTVVLEVTERPAEAPAADAPPALNNG